MGLNNRKKKKRIWGQRNPNALLVGLQIGTATMENSMEIFQKIKNGIIL